MARATPPLAVMPLAAGLVLALAMGVSASAQSVLTALEVFPDGDQVAIQGIVHGRTAGRVTATLEIETVAGIGRSRTRQSREFDVAPESREVVGATRVSLPTDGALNVTLEVMAGPRLLSRTTLSSEGAAR